MVRRVIAYDDEAALRKQLENVFLAMKAEYTLMAAFPHALQVVEHIKSYRPDLVLLDMDMRQNSEDGLVALYQIKKYYPDQKVMILTTFDADDKVFNAICLGADGYMLKTDFVDYLPQEVMRRSLHIIFSGGAYLTPAVAKKILALFHDGAIGDKINKTIERFKNLFAHDADPAHYPMKYNLSPAQQTTLEDIVRGKTAVEIAKERGVTENTVYTHIKAVYLKLEVHSRAQAVRKAIEEQIVNLNNK